MANVVAHLFKRRSIGDREEVDLKLFQPDGSPITIGETAEGTMVWRGAWSPVETYKRGEVVTNGGATFVFNEDVDPNAAPMFAGIPITKIKTGTWPQFTLTVNANSPKAEGISNVAGLVPFDAFTFRLGGSGYLDLVFQPASGGARDKLNGANWELVSTHDDESTNGHPGVYKSDATAGTYLFALTTKGGDTPAAYGTSNVFRGGAGGQAAYVDYVAFPSAKVTQIS